MLSVNENEVKAPDVKVEEEIDGAVTDKEDDVLEIPYVGDDGEAEVETSTGEKVKVDDDKVVIIKNGIKEAEEKEKDEKEYGEIELISFSPSSLYTNLDNQVNLSGENLGQVSEIIFKSESEEKNLTPVLVEDDFLGFNLENNFLNSGRYQILLKKSDGMMETDFYLDVKIADGPLIKDVTPNQGISGEQGMVVLQGQGFEDVIGIQLSNGTIISQASYEIISDRVIAVRVPQDLSVGEYKFRLVTEKGFFEGGDLSYTVITSS